MTEEQLLIWLDGYLAGWEQGDQARAAEVNAEYPPPRVYAFGRWYDQACERERADAETRRLFAEERAG